MKSVSVRKKCDLAYCVFVGLAFITVIIWQIFHLPLPPWLLTDLPLTDSSFVILQIQVTIVEGMTPRQKLRLRACRMLISYQKNGDFEFQSPRVERIFSGETGNLITQFIQHERYWSF